MFAIRICHSERSVLEKFVRVYSETLGSSDESPYLEIRSLVCVKQGVIIKVESLLGDVVVPYYLSISVSTTVLEDQLIIHVRSVKLLHLERGLVESLFAAESGPVYTIKTCLVSDHPCNVEALCRGRGDVETCADLCTRFARSRKNPRITHYSGTVDILDVAVNAWICIDPVRSDSFASKG